MLLKKVQYYEKSIMPHTDHLFPVSEYYHDHVVDGITIINAGGWWTALLLFEDPETEVRSLKLYRWRKRDGVWKNAGSNIPLKNKDIANKMRCAIDELAERL